MKTIEYKGRKALELSIVIAFLVYVWCVCGVSEIPKSSVEQYHKNWTFSYKGKETLIDIPSSQNVELGEPYEISHVISWDFPSESRILFRSLQQKVEILIDDNLIYRYPESKCFQDLTPNNWNMVDLPADSEGKLLTIRLQSEYEQFSGRIGEIYIGEYHAIFAHVRGKYLLSLIVGVMVGFIGCVILLVSVFAIQKKPHKAEISLGILFIFTSFWLCGEAKMPFTKVSSMTQYFFVFLSLLLIPAFFYLYIYFRMKEKNKKISLNVFWMNLMVFSGCFLLQITGIRDYPDMLPVIHGTIAIVFLCGIMVMGRELYKRSGIFKRQETGFVLLFLLAMGIEMIRFYLDQYQLLGIYIRLTLLLYAGSMLISSGIKMYRTAKENQRLSRMLQESKTDLMISQIQPHFIYNALNSIRTLIRIEPEQAYDMVYDFSKYLRAHIDSLSNEREIIFYRELEHIESYINIEKVRFGERLKVVYDIQTTSFYLPALSVQPLVENAIKHGICKKPEGGTVWIRSYDDKENEGGYVVEVEDDGVGFDVKKWEASGDKKKSAGIRNITFRVQAISNAHLSIESEINKGTKAIIKFPNRGGQSIDNENNNR